MTPAGSADGGDDHDDENGRLGEIPVACLNRIRPGRSPKQGDDEKSKAQKPNTTSTSGEQMQQAGMSGLTMRPGWQKAWSKKCAGRPAQRQPQQ